MTFTEAAAAVLRLVGKPLHYKEITDVAIERSLLSHVGKSPEVTMGARLAAQVKKTDKSNPLKRVKPGVFALADWDDAQIEAGLADRTPALEKLAKLEKEQGSAPVVETEAPEESPIEEDESKVSSAAEPAAAHMELDDEAAPPDEEEQHRAELTATATGMFEEEDDDDQPIFGAPAAESVETEDSSEASEGKEGKRRRRRRRGRGRRDEEGSSEEGGEDMPSYTVSDAEPEEVLSAADLGSDLSDGEEAAPSLAGAIEAALGRYDKNRGPVAAQNVADALKRQFKGDASISGAAVIAAAAADNLAAERGQTGARFVISGNKLGLSAWGQDKKLLERQRAALKALDNLSDSVQKALSDELNRVPQRAVGDLVLVLLERMGVSDVRAIRRPGSHGAELHLAGRLTLGDAIRTKVAILVRRDGKDIGRERVTELRGAMHHYDGAKVGWVISTGQVLSGAREEAQTDGAAPVTLTGRSELAALCVKHGVGVRVQRVEVPSLDSELFELLSAR